MDELHPYDPPPRGVKYWAQRFPNAGPDRTPPEQEKTVGRDGEVRPRGHLTGLPVRHQAADPDDMGVRDWAPWPP